MRDDSAKPPRFPYVAALLCVACLGAAAWTWMMYSYCREMRTDEWPGRDPYPIPMSTEAGSSSIEVSTGRYVQVKGCVRRCLPVTFTRIDFTRIDGGRDSNEHMGWKLRLVREGRAILVCYPRTHDAPTKEGAEVVIRGRVEGIPWDFLISSELIVNATASRFHGGSIAGLVVGAMGVFVFTMALRHWLNERRAFREEAAGA